MRGRSGRETSHDFYTRGRRGRNSHCRGRDRRGGRQRQSFDSAIAPSVSVHDMEEETQNLVRSSPREETQVWGELDDFQNGTEGANWQGTEDMVSSLPEDKECPFEKSRRTGEWGLEDEPQVSGSRNKSSQSQL